jgi:Meiotically up-regulated gene 113
VVYLVRSVDESQPGGVRAFFKIGMTLDFKSRLEQIKLQLPFKVEEVHRIETDDPEGLERYWHRRFSEKRRNGEWFELSEEDVRIFICRDRM